MAQATRISISDTQRSVPEGSSRAEPAWDGRNLNDRLQKAQPDEQLEAAMGWATAQPEENRPSDRRSDDVLPASIASLADPSTAGPASTNEPLPGRIDSDPAINAARDKLIDDLGVMKRTRFNAQARFEAKHTASVSAFTLAAVIEIALSLFGSNFTSNIAADVAAFVNYTSQVAAVFFLSFGLVATLKNYQTSALYLQRCAMDWNNLRRELQIAGPVEREVLQDFRRRYHEIEGRCTANHSDVDYVRAKLDPTDIKGHRRNRLDYFVDVYLVYACSGLVFVAFWITLWHFMVG